MKKLSIIIVNFNTSNFIINCLNSLLDGIYFRQISKNWELIVIDNHSTEDLKKLKNYLNSYPMEKRLLENTQNLGFSKASNQAIAGAKGEYILFLNPDTIISAETLIFLLDYISSDKKVGIVTPKITLPNGKIDDASHRGFPTPWNAFCYFSNLAKIFPHSQFFNGYHLGYKKIREIHEIDACCGAFMMVSRKCGEEINWFDEDYFWYGEDLDFCYRVKQKNWKVVWMPEVKIIHFKGVSSGIKKESQKLTTAGAQTVKQAQKARFEAMRIFYRKNYSGKYPVFITKLVFLAIKVKEILAT